MNIRGLLFDKDGTLFDFQKTWGGWYGTLLADLSKGDTALHQHLAGRLGFDLERQQVHPGSPLVAQTLPEILAQIHELLPHWTEADLYDHTFGLSLTLEQVPVVPLAPLLQQFRRHGLILGVATNDSESAARSHLDRAGVADHFDYTAGFDSGHGAKPGPGMLLAFCDATGLPPEQVLMVGDSTHDLIAGRAAGMGTVGVLTGTAGYDDLAPHADQVLRHIGEIPEILRITT